MKTGTADNDFLDNMKIAREKRFAESKAKRDAKANERNNNNPNNTRSRVQNFASDQSQYQAKKASSSRSSINDISSGVTRGSQNQRRESPNTGKLEALRKKSDEIFAKYNKVGTTAANGTTTVTKNAPPSNTSSVVSTKTSTTIQTQGKTASSIPDDFVGKMQQERPCHRPRQIRVTPLVACLISDLQ